LNSNKEKAVINKDNIVKIAHLLFEKQVRKTRETKKPQLQL